MCREFELDSSFRLNSRDSLFYVHIHKSSSMAQRYRHTSQNTKQRREEAPRVQLRDFRLLASSCVKAARCAKYARPEYLQPPADKGSSPRQCPGTSSQATHGGPDPPRQSRRAQRGPAALSAPTSLIPAAKWSPGVPATTPRCVVFIIINKFIQCILVDAIDQRLRPSFKTSRLDSCSRIKLNLNTRLNFH